MPREGYFELAKASAGCCGWRRHFFRVPAGGGACRVPKPSGPPARVLFFWLLGFCSVGPWLEGRTPSLSWMT